MLARIRREAFLGKLEQLAMYLLTIHHGLLLRLLFARFKLLLVIFLNANFELASRLQSYRHAEFGLVRTAGEDLVHTPEGTVGIV